MRGRRERTRLRTPEGGGIAELEANVGTPDAEHADINSSAKCSNGSRAGGGERHRSGDRRTQQEAGVHVKKTVKAPTRAAGNAFAQAKVSKNVYEVDTIIGVHHDGEDGGRRRAKGKYTPGVLLKGGDRTDLGLHDAARRAPPDGTYAAATTIGGRDHLRARERARGSATAPRSGGMSPPTAERQGAEGEGDYYVAARCTYAAASKYVGWR